MLRSGLIAILLAGLATGAGVELLLYLDGSLPQPPAVVLALLVGWSFIASGVVAWARRPDNRTGLLMVIVGFLWFLGLLGFAEQRELHWSGDLLGRPLQVAVFAYLLLTFPNGRLETRAARVLAVAAFIDACIVRNSSRLVDDDRLAGRIFDASEVAIIVIFLGIIVLLASRWRAGSAAWRRAVAPLLLPGAVALSMLILFFANDVAGRPLGETPGWLYRIAFAILPILFLAGLLRMRLARAGVADLLVELERPPSGELRTRSPAPSTTPRSSSPTGCLTSRRSSTGRPGRSSCPRRMEAAASPPAPRRRHRRRSGPRRRPGRRARAGPAVAATGRLTIENQRLRRRSGPSSRRSAPPGRGSWSSATPSAAGSSATSTTAPSSGWSTSRSLSGSPAPRSRPPPTGSWRPPSTKRPRSYGSPWPNSASWPGGSTR